MKKLTIIAGVCLALASNYTFAHHPTEDLVDEDIYILIDSMVADTPHAEMIFDDEMGTSTIIVDSVSEAEDVIDDGLLATLSLLEEDVMITITFGDDIEAMTVSSSAGPAMKSKYWSGWGRPVYIKVNTLLRVEDK